MRTIPTRVGRTRPARTDAHCAPDHPHAGGENWLAWGTAAPGDGPSPRGWGEQLFRVQRSRLKRTIPTRVGRTSVWQAGNGVLTDHPHAGGENIARNAFAQNVGGPSPRGWGEPRRRPPGRRVHRTIPTRVGRTPIRRSAGRLESDHPHAGGENGLAFRRMSPGAGPSPRGWGEPTPAKRTRGAGRTIPTRVGRTGRQRAAPFKAADHPHAGGENALKRTGPMPGAGPSPRGWGELPAIRAGLAVVRTIPTRVGRTPSGSISLRITPDHPHAGGENYTPGTGEIPIFGPSPRGWGELLPQFGVFFRFRTIPTRVGRTTS